MQQGTQDIIEVAKRLRSIAKAYPAASPIVMEMNDKIRELMRVVMQHQQTAEPAAPPNGG